MALISRLTRLFHADMNAVLDQIEEPDILLRQSIREMQENLTQQESQLKLAEFETQQLGKKEQEIKQFLSELEEQLALCFKSNKEELAHGLVKRKLEIKQTQNSISTKISNTVEKTDLLNKKYQEQLAQLASLKQKAELLSPNSNSGPSQSSWNINSLSISDEDIEIAFLKEKQNWSQS